MAQISTSIYAIIAREILDSRGDPTIETTVVLESGYRGTTSIPAGTSMGKYEAVELRDKDEKRYNGMGVLKAVSNVNTTIAQALKGMDVLKQADIDKKMRDLDGTSDKHNLGANSILSVSIAAAKAAAAASRLPLYQYLNMLYQSYIHVSIVRIPTPTFNLINGGRHGAGNLDFQEFHVVPATNKKFSDALRMGVEIYESVKNILKYRNAIYSVGYEGGFAPNLYTNMEAIEVIAEAIRNTPYKAGLEVFLGLDLAANSFKHERGYQIKDKPGTLSSVDFIKYVHEIHKKNRMLILEDALGEDEWEHWAQLTREMGSEVLIVGDDLLCTNPERLNRAIKEKACSAILVKPNQIGTLSEFLDVITIAKKNDIKIIVSHRSGETNDSCIADIAVAVQSDYVKFGAPARGERVAKYNRLLEIAAELKL